MFNRIGSRLLAFCFGSLGVTAALSSAAQQVPPASLVVDLDPSQTSRPRLATEILEQGDLTYFGGNELVVTDGTAAGTTQLTNISPYGCCLGVAHLTPLAGLLYFSGNDNVRGAELWSYDPLSHEQRLAANLAPSFYSSSPSALTPLAGKLFFVALDPASSLSNLWRYDPTTNGAEQLGAGSLTGAQELTVLGNRLYASSNSGLWVHDPSANTLVRASSAGPANTGNLTVVGNQLFMVSGTSLWRFDPANSSSYEYAGGFEFFTPYGVDVPQLTALSGKLFFVTIFKAYGQSETGRRLMVYDPATGWATTLLEMKANLSGTPSGQVTSVHVGGVSHTASRLFFHTQPQCATVGGCSASFVGTVPREIWVHDPALGTTARLSTLLPQLEGRDARVLATDNGSLYAALTNGDGTEELWRIAENFQSSQVLAMTAAGTSFGTTFVTANRLYYNELTSKSQRLVTISLANRARQDLSAPEGSSGYIGSAKVPDDGIADPSRNPVTIGSGLYFMASNGSGQAVWAYDAASASTRLIPSSAGARRLATAAGDLFFTTAPSDNSGPTRKFWRYSPNTGQSVPLTADIGFRYLNQLKAHGDYLYFSGDTAGQGEELWRMKLSTGSAQAIADLYPGSAGSYPSKLTSLNQLLVFQAELGSSALFAHDPASGQTWKIRDIEPGANSQPIVVAGKLYFNAGELFVYDPLVDTTRMVDVCPGACLSFPRELTALGSDVVFRASVTGTSTGPLALMALSTVNGQVRVLNADVGDVSSLRAVGSKLAMVVTSLSLGRELQWYNSDTGLTSIIDIHPGAAGSDPSLLWSKDGALLLSASSGSDLGQALWRSAGTPATTQLVQDIGPGIFSSIPHDPTELGDRLYFGVNDETHGEELWSARTLDLTGPTATTSPVPATNLAKTLLTALGLLLLALAVLMHAYARAGAGTRART